MYSWFWHYPCSLPEIHPCLILQSSCLTATKEQWSICFILLNEIFFWPSACWHLSMQEMQSQQRLRVSAASLHSQCAAAASRKGLSQLACSRRQNRSWPSSCPSSVLSGTLDHSEFPGRHDRGHRTWWPPGLVGVSRDILDVKMLHKLEYTGQSPGRVCVCVSFTVWPCKINTLSLAKEF